MARRSPENGAHSRLIERSGREAFVACWSHMAGSSLRRPEVGGGDSSQSRRQEDTDPEWGLQPTAPRLQVAFYDQPCSHSAPRLGAESQG